VAVDDVDFHMVDIVLLESNFLVNTVMTVGDMDQFYIVHVVAYVEVVQDFVRDIHFVALAAQSQAFHPFVDLLNWECSYFVDSLAVDWALPFLANDYSTVLEAFVDFVVPLLETSIENQMMSYLEMKLASLVAVVVLASFVLQAATHCLLVEAVLVDSTPLNWKYFHWNYSEPQQLLLAFVAS
jgi:hypothetical protein